VSTPTTQVSGPAASVPDVQSHLLTELSQAVEDSQTKPYDAVVVGGGSAGIIAARTLAERGRRVLILEAGPLILLTHVMTTDLRFDRELVRAIQTSLQYSPASENGPFGALIGCVGGRGLFWDGAAPRFRAEDFANWPLTAAELDSFYQWAEAEFMVNTTYGGGALGHEICRLLRRAGLAAELGRLAVDTSATRDGWVGGTVGNAFAPLLRSGLLTAQPRKLALAAEVFVEKVVFDETGAHGVLAHDRKSGQSLTVHARSVVLAAGGFESVRLAMVSQVPDRSGRLGRFLSDHLFCRAFYPFPPELYDAQEPEVAIVAVPADDTERYQIEVHLPSDNIYRLRDRARWSPDRSRDYAAMVRSFAPVRPRSENCLQPSVGSKPGSYTVHLNYSPEDWALLEQMRAGLEKVRVALGADPAEIQTLPAGASHHEAGGLMMGADPTNSVTNPHGQFHSIRNLVAVDASTWPGCAAANPHLTIAALARRQASLLSQHL